MFTKKSFGFSDIYGKNGLIKLYFLLQRYTCLAVFMWKTSLVCQNWQRQCAFDVDGKHYDFNLLSSLSHNWISTDANNITYVFILFSIRSIFLILFICSVSNLFMCINDKILKLIFHL